MGVSRSGLATDGGGCFELSGWDPVLHDHPPPVLKKGSEDSAVVAIVSPTPLEEQSGQSALSVSDPAVPKRPRVHDLLLGSVGPHTARLLDTLHQVPQIPPGLVHPASHDHHPAPMIEQMLDRLARGAVSATVCPMGRRIDYIDDPNAPKINSVVPSVVAIVLDDHGRVLLIHKTDNDLWALPGGGHEPGESIRDTVVREVKEETGYDVEVTGISGTYTNPGHVMAYEDGEVRQQFSIAFTARLIGGDARTSSESRRVEWVEPSEIAALDMHPSMRMRVEHGISGGPIYIG